MGAGARGLQNPRRPDSLLARVALDVAAVTTSGDYEQFFVEDGVRYHHIFDAGWPARGVASVSVFADDPIAADCYATADFVLGPERGLEFLRQRADLRGVIVTETRDGKLLLSWDESTVPPRREGVHEMKPVEAEPPILRKPRKLTGSRGSGRASPKHSSY